MATTDTVLRRSIEARGDKLILTLDPVFQGLPGTAHGGSVLAAFDALAGCTAPREVAGLSGAILVSGSLYLLAELAAVRPTGLPWERSASE